MVVVTEVFANLAQTAARARGYEHLDMLVLPHPMETRPRDEVDSHRGRTRRASVLQALVDPRPVSQFDADHS